MLLFDPSIYHYTLHASMVLSVGAGIFILGVFVMVRERWSRGGFKFFLFTSAVGLWLCGFGMAYASIWEPSAFRWFLAGEVGVMFVPPTVLSLAVSVVQRDRELRAPVWLSFAIAMLFCSILLTTDLLFRELQLYSWGWYPRFGWVGVLFSAYFAVVGIFIISLYYRKYRRTTHVRTRRRLGWVLSALCIGYLASADFAPSLGIPLYPFGYIPAAIYLIVLTYITVQYRLMDIRPELATGLVLETMHGAVIVVDLEDTVRVINGVAGEMLGVGRRELLGRT
jgi:two-component system CAI-1 autoinducer sensor kinase/phosphatase CqsS